MSWPDSNRRPTSVCRSKPTSEYSCQLSYTTHRIYIPSYKQLAATPAYAYDAEPIRTIGLAIRILYYSFSMLRCYRNHSAFNSHNFPRTMVLMVHATTSQPYCLHLDLTRRSSLVRKLPASDCCTRGPLSCRLFPLALQLGLFRCRFSSGLCTSLATFRWVTVSSPIRLTRHPSCHCVFSIFSLLAGIATARPSAFVEGDGVEPSAHPRLFDVTAEG